MEEVDCFVQISMLLCHGEQNQIPIKNARRSDRLRRFTVVSTNLSYSVLLNTHKSHCGGPEHYRRGRRSARNAKFALPSIRFVAQHHTTSQSARYTRLATRKFSFGVGWKPTVGLDVQKIPCRSPPDGRTLGHSNMSRCPG